MTSILLRGQCCIILCSQKNCSQLLVAVPQRQFNMSIKVVAMQTKSGASIHKQPFGQLPGGETINLYTLTNRNDIQMQVISYGGIVVSLKTPDRAGKFADI